MTKDEIRVKVRQQRRSLDPKWVADTSVAAQRRILEMEAFRSAAAVCSYSSARHEVQTDLIASVCWEEGKMLYVPVFCMESDSYRFALLSRDSEVEKGPMQIPQPMNPNWIEQSDSVLLIVPGVGFDLRCGRVGHGGGYYDKMLPGIVSSVRDAFLIGLAFEFQVFDNVPMEGTDVRMDALVTEERTVDLTVRQA